VRGLLSHPQARAVPASWIAGTRYLWPSLAIGEYDTPHERAFGPSPRGIRADPAKPPSKVQGVPTPVSAAGWAAGILRRAEESGPVNCFPCPTGAWLPCTWPTWSESLSSTSIQAKSCFPSEALAATSGARAARTGSWHMPMCLANLSDCRMYRRRSWWTRRCGRVFSGSVARTGNCGILRLSRQTYPPPVGLCLATVAVADSLVAGEPDLGDLAAAPVVQVPLQMKRAVRGGRHGNNVLEHLRRTGLGQGTMKYVG